MTDRCAIRQACQNLNWDQGDTRRDIDVPDDPEVRCQLELHTTLNMVFSIGGYPEGAFINNQTTAATNDPVSLSRMAVLATLTYWYIPCIFAFTLSVIVVDTVSCTDLVLEVKLISCALRFYTCGSTPNWTRCRSCSTRVPQARKDPLRPRKRV